MKRKAVKEAFRVSEGRDDVGPSKAFVIGRIAVSFQSFVNSGTFVIIKPASGGGPVGYKKIA